MSHQISVDPADHARIHISDLEQVVHGAVVRNRCNMRCLLEVGSLKIPQKPLDHIT
ncbi:hypothetical protein SynBIOSE41_02399 [Synechococcus sp. BIOS-E4-1]|nr:hypothetical protein SynBIOSE41_02399 [Synechococcus sp. BIOS-E4-1]